MDQSAQIAALSKKMDTLLSIVMNDKIKSDWMDEVVAATMCGLSTEYFRRSVKAGKGEIGKIHWRQSGKVIQYSRKSIEKFQQATSTY